MLGTTQHSVKKWCFHCDSLTLLICQGLFTRHLGKKKKKMNTRLRFNSVKRIREHDLIEWKLTEYYLSSLAFKCVLWTSYTFKISFCSMIFSEKQG